MDRVELLFVKMSPNAVTPTRDTEKSVGLDFYSPANYLIPPYSQLLIPTQIKLRIPLGHYGRLTSKSGLAILHYLHVGAGVIEPDYMGEIKVLLTNTAPHTHSIVRGDPIAQLILEKVSLPVLKRVKELPPTTRGSKAQALELSVYMSCISKTTCFLVNCAPLFLQFGQNEEPKGSNGSRPSEYDHPTPPSKLDTAPFWHAKPWPIRDFPTIEPVMF